MDLTALDITEDQNDTEYPCEFCHADKSTADVWCEKHKMYHHFCPSCFILFDKTIPLKIDSASAFGDESRN